MGGDRRGSWGPSCTLSLDSPVILSVVRSELALLRLETWKNANKHLSGRTLQKEWLHASVVGSSMTSKHTQHVTCSSRSSSAMTEDGDEGWRGRLTGQLSSNGPSDALPRTHTNTPHTTRAQQNFNTISALPTTQSHRHERIQPGTSGISCGLYLLETSI
jgi:hypothetical protein